MVSFSDLPFFALRHRLERVVPEWEFHLLVRLPSKLCVKPCDQPRSYYAGIIHNALIILPHGTLGVIKGGRRLWHNEVENDGSGVNKISGFIARLRNKNDTLRVRSTTIAVAISY